MVCSTALLAQVVVAAAADVHDSVAVPQLKEQGRADYLKFVAAPPARAFAISDGGAYGWASKRDDRVTAARAALYNCNKVAKNICRVYAVNDDVVYDRYLAYEQRSATLTEKLRGERITAGGYGDEARDYGVPSGDTLRNDDLHSDTPLTLENVRTIKTVDLARMLMAPSPPVLIDAVEGTGHDTLPGAYWIRGVGLASKDADANAEIRDRLAMVLTGLTKGEKTAPIVFFCVDSQCWLSYNAALRARELGYSNVHWYRGGAKAWKEARLPMLEAVQYGQVR